MASVYVDVPGIGTIEAKNAASEATLLEILKVLQGQKKGSGKPAAAGETPADKNLEQTKEKQATTFEKLNKRTSAVIGGMSRLGESITGTIKQFADVGDSVQDAAHVFNKIPIVGDMFAAVASSATKVTDSFQSATASGATFGGSIQKFAGNASAAGMTMDKFGQLIARNGESLRLLGGDTATGAKRFSEISKTLRTSSNDLYNLGYSTEDVNQGMANYAKYLGQTGKIGNQTNAQLAAGAKDYLKEMDLLAKVTGTTRKEQEDARAKLLNDAQFQGKVANMSIDAGKAFANTVQMLPAGLQDVAKDIMVTGTATTEESQKFMAMMPKSAALMQKYAAITDAGGTITAEMQNNLNNMLAAEGESASKQYAVLGKFNKDFAGTFNQVTAARNIQVDSLKNATKEQKEAAEKQATLAAAMETNKQALSELSNTFQIALANSGILDLMMNAFQFLANLTQTYLIPAFNTMAAVVTSVGGFLLENLKPVFEWLTGFIRETLYPTFLKLAGIFIVDVLPVLQTLATIIKDYILPTMLFLGGVIYDYVISPFLSLAGTIYDNLTPILLGLGTALGLFAGYIVATNLANIANIAVTVAKTVAMIALLAPLALLAVGVSLVAAGFAMLTSPIGLVVLGVVALIAGFKALYDTGWTLGSAFDAIKDNFSRGLIYLEEAWAKFKGWFSRETEEDKKAKENREKRKKALDDREKARDDERAKIAEGRDKQKKRDEASEKIDQKIINLKKNSADSLADANRKEKAALEERTDLNTADSVALLGQELKSQKSAILPKAEAAKKEIEQKGVAKQAEEATTKEDAKKKAQADQEAAKTAAGPVKTQESAESLLASLNTKLDQLIAVGKFQAAINERQLSAAQAMSGDLHKMA